MARAALGPVNIEPPPLIVGGGSQGGMEVAARHAQAWYLFTQDPEEFRRRGEVLTSIERAAGRREPLARSVYFFVERVDRDLPHTLRDFERAGAEEAMLALLHPTRDAVLEIARSVM